MGWLICVFLGHLRTDWYPVEWVHDTLTGYTTEWVWTTNQRSEARYCLRCRGGYEQRAAA